VIGLLQSSVSFRQAAEAGDERSALPPAAPHQRQPAAQLPRGRRRSWADSSGTSESIGAVEDSIGDSTVDEIATIGGQPPAVVLGPR
jgi:hypothetical protein